MDALWQKFVGYETLSQDLTSKPARRPLQSGLIVALLSSLCGLFVLHHFYYPLGTEPSSSVSHFSLQTTGNRRVCIVMHNSNDTAMFHSPDHGSNPNHAEYADIHGYPYRLASQPYVNWFDRAPQTGWIKSSGEHGYNKIIHLADSVLHGMKTNEYDWVFWAVRLLCMFFGVGFQADIGRRYLDNQPDYRAGKLPATIKHRLRETTGAIFPGHCGRKRVQRWHLFPPR